MIISEAKFAVRKHSLTSSAQFSFILYFCLTRYLKSIRSAMEPTLQLPLYTDSGRTSPVVLGGTGLSLPHHRTHALGDTDFSRAGSPAFSTFSGSHIYQNENVSTFGDDSDSPTSGIYSAMSSGLTSHLSNNNNFDKLHRSVSYSIIPSKKKLF